MTSSILLSIGMLINGRIMSPKRMGGGHIVFGVDPVSVSVDAALPCVLVGSLKPNLHVQ